MKNRYFISIDGICKDCGYPVICEAGQIVEGSSDFHLFCSNPDCINKNGICVFDDDIDEDYIPFLIPAKVSIKLDVAEHQ